MAQEAVSRKTDHFRGKARHGRRVAVHMKRVEEDGNLGDAVAGYTANLGGGGAFVVTDDPWPRGTTGEIAISLPGGAVVVKAEVRWVSETDDDSTRGMGLRFEALDVDQQMRLNEYFTALTGTDG